MTGPRSGRSGPGPDRGPHRRGVIVAIHLLAALGQQRLGPAEALPCVAAGDQPRHQDQRPRDRGGPRRPDHRMRMAPAPLPPALGQAAVGDAAERQVGQMSAQILGQSGGVGITVAWVDGPGTWRRCPPVPRGRRRGRRNPIGCDG